MAPKSKKRRLADEDGKEVDNKQEEDTKKQPTTTFTSFDDWFGQGLLFFDTHQVNLTEAIDKLEILTEQLKQVHEKERISKLMSSLVKSLSDQPWFKHASKPEQAALRQAIRNWSFSVRTENMELVDEYEGSEIAGYYCSMDIDGKQFGSIRYSFVFPEEGNREFDPEEKLVLTVGHGENHVETVSELWKYVGYERSISLELFIHALGYFVDMNDTFDEEILLGANLQSLLHTHKEPTASTVVVATK